MVRSQFHCDAWGHPIVAGAGTGTFEFETASGVYTELQCGSYIFMDADYGRNRDRDGEPSWRDVIRNSGSGLAPLSGIGTELHKRRRRLGCSSLGLGGLGRRVNSQQQAHHQALPKKS
jgi:hypothetical protein